MLIKFYFSGIKTNQFIIIIFIQVYFKYKSEKTRLSLKGYEVHEI